MRKLLIIAGVLAASAVFILDLSAQDIKDWITGAGGKPALAVTNDLRGSGTQEFMAPFNSTLFTDLQSSALFEMKAKSMFPLANPQRPEDLRQEDNNPITKPVDGAVDGAVKGVGGTVGGVRAAARRGRSAAASRLSSSRSIHRRATSWSSPSCWTDR